MAKKWMQKAFPEKTKGALHRALGIPEDQDIPTERLNREISRLQKKAEGEKKLIKGELRLLRMSIAARNAKRIAAKK